jgi:hypothetical protein
MNNSAAVGFFAVCLLSGCATVRPPTAVFGAFARTQEQNYKINEPKTVFVGETMIKRRDYYARHVSQNDMIVPSNDCAIIFSRIIGPTRQTSFKRGQEIKIIGEIDLEGSFCRFFPFTEFSALVFPSGELVKNKFAFNDPLIGWRVVVGSNVRVEPETTRFSAKSRDEIDATKPFVNFEVLYTGRSGNTINLVYREYTPDDLAKSAFFQNLSYDATATTIRFRKLRIEVSQADNEKITFTVLED